MELCKSASANVTDYKSADKARLISYFDQLRKYIAWAVSQPEMDFVETHPLSQTLPPCPAIPDTENPDTQDLIQLFSRMRDELVNCQSARMASGLVSHDQERFLSIIERGEKYLAEYIDDTAPLDLPESTPHLPVTGAGNVGV
jgi:hypothetical protein